MARYIEHLRLDKYTLNRESSSVEEMGRVGLQMIGEPKVTFNTDTKKYSPDSSVGIMVGDYDLLREDAIRLARGLGVSLKIVDHDLMEDIYNARAALQEFDLNPATGGVT